MYHPACKKRTLKIESTSELAENLSSLHSWASVRARQKNVSRFICGLRWRLEKTKQYGERKVKPEEIKAKIELEYEGARDGRRIYEGAVRNAQVPTACLPTPPDDPYSSYIHSVNWLASVPRSCSLCVCRLVLL
uniref:HMG box domain-containing protein n=1 Tax=Ascaris lumbricoides TaxID=6252 RepID=A0A0M3I0N7_ASCLU